MEIKEDLPENRIDHMEYLPGMEVLESEVQQKVIERMVRLPLRTVNAHRKILRRFCRRLPFLF